MKLDLKIVPAVTFLLVSLFILFLIKPTTDTYFHLSIGRFVFENKQIPTIDPFVYRPHEAKFTSFEWLAGLVMFLFVKTLGEIGIPALRLLLSMSSFFLLYKTLRLAKIDTYLASLAVFIAAYTLAFRLYDRPENFSLLFFAVINFAFFHLLYKKRGHPIGFLIPFIFLAWPNMHAFSIIGLLLYLATTMIILVNVKDFEKNEIKKLIIIFIAVLFVSIPQYHRLIYVPASTNFAKTYDTFQISEFRTFAQRLMMNDGYDFFNQIPLYVYIYFFTLPLYLVLIILKFRREKIKYYPIHILYLAVFLLPFKLFRLLGIAVFISQPDFLGLLAQFAKKITLPVKIALLAISAFFAASLINGHILADREQVIVTNFIPEKSQESKPVAIQNRFYFSTFPREKITLVVKNDLATKRFFSAPYWANYFLWKIPGTKSFASGLIDYTTATDLEIQKKIEDGGDNWEKLIADLNIDTVINSQAISFVHNDTPVYKLKNWKLIYLDETVILYAREDIIKNLSLDLSAIDPYLKQPIKFNAENQKLAGEQLQKLVDFDPQNVFARNQLFYYYLASDISKAKKLTQESMILLPKRPEFSLQMATIYAREGNCPQAEAFTREAVAKSFNYRIFKLGIEDATRECHKTQ